jgi:hypothetical protein
MFRIGRDVVDDSLPYITRERFSDIPYAVIDVLGGTLGDHFDRSVPQVANEAGEPMAMGHPVGGEAKTDALNVTGEYYVLRNHS